MAGDWIKMQTCLPDKPEVWRIASIIGTDPDAVIGKLLRVWSWFDSHTEDGNALGVTYSLVDRVSGVTGFAEAMALCGWLEQNGTILSLPKFGRHNGKTAKNRALTNERVAKTRQKSNAECNAATVTKTVTREEKRREEVNLKSKAGATATRLPADWVPSDVDYEFCVKERPDLAPNDVADRFRDYWIAVPGAKGRKADWVATWRNWVRNERKGGTSNGSNRESVVADFTGAGRGKPAVFDGSSGRVVEGSGSRV